MKLFCKTLFSYIKHHMMLIIANIISLGIFTFVFFLYNLPFEAVMYASLLSLVLLTVIGIIQFSSYYKRHEVLERIKERMNHFSSLEEFPEPSSQIEIDYQEVIDLLEQGRKALLSQKDRTLTDMTDYYTLWAHQIKTPIAAMRLLLQTEQSDQNAEISEQLFKIEQYVEMVLGYLRTENMSNDLDIKICSLDDLIRQTARKFAKSFIRKKISLDYDPIVQNLLTDEKWLSFVLEQIISNALKYTPEGGRIRIYLENSTNPVLVIEDTGIGIQPEDLPRVGEKGFTGYNGRENKKSTGIGLYLCNKIVKNLSHSLQVESIIGKGTKVKIGFFPSIKNRYE